MNKSVKLLSTTLVVAVLALSIVSVMVPSDVAFAGSAVGGNGGNGGTGGNGGIAVFGSANGGDANGGNGGDALCDFFSCIA
jgi:hypothetical protein